MTTENKADGDIAACADIARHHDRERYLVSLFAGAGARDDLLVLLAANHEIARVAEVVSEETIGLIRLQWWREALEGIAAGTPRQHEVVLALATVIGRHPGVADALRRAIDAREVDLTPEPFGDLSALETYATNTGGAVGAGMGAVLASDPVVAEAIGTAWALVGVVRALPHSVARRWVPLPISLLQENGVTSSKVVDSFASVDLANLCRPIVDQARKVLEQTPGGRTLAPPLRLLAARTGHLIADLERHGCDPRVPAVQAASPGLVWRHAARALLYRLGG